MSATPQQAPTNPGENLRKQIETFSLMSGGPLYQLLRRTRLCGPALEGVAGRILALIIVGWVPLLVLSFVEGHALGGGVELPFLFDIETQLRFLVAAPLLVFAEVKAHQLLPLILGLFEDNGLVSDAGRPKFDAAVASAAKLRNSIWVELLLLAFIYAVGVPFVWRDQMTLDVSSWYATTVGGSLHPWLAGRWLGFVSMPLFMFLTLRWFFRCFVWARLLVHIAGSGLQLEASHPDGNAGLAFMGRVGRAYRFVGMALGAVLSGMIANRIFHTGATLPQFKAEIVGIAVLLVALIYGPLLAFYGPLRTTRRWGQIQYGTLGQAYAREFSRKWIHGPRPAGEALLGSPDIQSLADLHNSFQVVRGIRLVPFRAKNVTEFVAATLLPVAPLLLTMFSAEELIQRLLKALF